MYKELDGIIPPSDKTTLWRYTNFEKFVNLLDTKSLFYTRADKFEKVVGLLLKSIQHERNTQ